MMSFSLIFIGLFVLQVLVPRYRSYNRSYTRLYRLQRPPHPDPHAYIAQGFGVLELHGNPWPPIGKPHLPKRAANEKGPLSTEPYKNVYFINVLLNAAREEKEATRRAKNHKPPVE